MNPVAQARPTHLTDPTLQPGLIRHCGIADPQAWWEDWQARLSHLECLAAPMDPSLLKHFGLPMLERLKLLAKAGGRPVLAVNAPVGSGKTSLGKVLAQLAPNRNLRLAVASIDDFYLPWRQRLKAMAGNPFGVTRVPPGSHDPELLCQVLDHWRSGGCLSLPRFDKTLRQGQGDRCRGSSEDADALVIEGWLLGCRALQSQLTAGLNRLIERESSGGAPTLSPAEAAWIPHWDDALKGYEPAWQRCNELWLLRPQTWNLPCRWRFQAEARQRREGGRREGGGSLDANALEKLVRSSLCSLPPALYQEPLLPEVPCATTRRKGDAGGITGGSHQRGMETGIKSGINHGRAGDPRSLVGRSWSSEVGATKLQAVAAAVLDGRRRLSRLISAPDQPSVDSSSSAIG
jgi:D-glycerate 3-kinase